MMADGGMDMLKKQYRIRHNADFRRIYRQSKSISTKYLVLYPRKVKGEGIRVGFSVSKKVGKAHIRNYYKRRLSEIIRRNFDKIQTGYDLVFVARTPIVELTYGELEKNVVFLLKKSGVLKHE